MDYQDRIADEGAETIHHRMCQDWLSALSAVDDARWVGGPSVAFLGMSMGARYGLPVCAAIAPRLRCAIFGKFGLTQSDRLPGALAANDVVTAAAETIRAPILQHVQWHDEIFPRTGQLDLFELFASPDKLLRGRPGSHALTHPDDEIAWREYVTAHLNHP